MHSTDSHPDQAAYLPEGAVQDLNAEHRFHFLIAVWGESYVNQMLKVALPSLMANGNLPVFSGIPGSKFVFITREQDRPHIAQSGVVAKLAKIMEVRYLLFKPSASANGHHAMSAAHRIAAVEATAERAFAVVLSPDLVMSTGSLATVLRLARSGKRAVMIPGLRLTEETAHPVLAHELAIDSDPAILQPRELVRFALHHLHPETKQYFWDSPLFSPNPVCCVWPVDNEGLLVRCFHLHPLLVDFRQRNALEKLSDDTIDGAFVGHSIGNWSDIHVEQNSDRILAFSFTSDTDRVDSVRENAATENLLRMTAYAGHVNPLHRMFFTVPLFLHTNGISDSFRAKADETGFAAFRILDIKHRVLGIGPGPMRETSLKSARWVLRAMGLWPLVQRLRGRS